MSTESLTVLPYGKPPFTIELTEDNGHRGIVERIIRSSTDSVSIFSDLSYEFTLNCDNMSEIEDVRVFINDTFEPSVFTDGKITFPENGNRYKKIFLDCYGFVELGIALLFRDGHERDLFSEHIPVLVRRGELNSSIKAMVDFVYEHQESLLLNGEPKPRDMTGLKANGYKSLSAQIILADEIATIYEASYGFFRANSRFRIEKEATTTRLEQLQYMTPATLEYISSHPEHLRPTVGNVGIRIGKRSYHPIKTLSLQNVSTRNIYENRVILGFLWKMVDEMDVLSNECSKLICRIPQKEDYDTEYVFSSFFMFSETKKSLEIAKQEIAQLHDRFVQLIALYSDALSIDRRQLDRHPEDIGAPPRPTGAFLSVPEYNKVFIRIHKWYNFGIYDFAKEAFILSFLKLSSLYESYLLVKLINFFTDSGYAVKSSKYSYPVFEKWKYKNTKCDNTFYLSNGCRQIVLYYQPVLFDTDKGKFNGIGLYRNNSINIHSEEYDGGHYYVPDFLIKFDDGDTHKYLIIDAKFSDFNTVRKYHIKDLAFKYLFSVSPLSNMDSIDGLCVIYGKCSEKGQLVSAYDKQLDGQPIKPFADILPLLEGISQNEQYDKLKLLFGKYLLN